MKNQTVIHLSIDQKLASGAASLESRHKLLVIAMAFFGLISAVNSAVAVEVHEAHTHGAANLSLVVESGALELQLESPAMSLLGFEHQPKTQQQRDVIEKTKEILSTPAKWVSADGANCAANNVEVEMHGPAGHATIHKEKSDADHSHQELEENGEHETNHSEIFATYRFDCDASEKIETIVIGLFEHFSNLNEINVNWVTESQQGQITLSSKSSIIEIR